MLKVKRSSDGKVLKGNEEVLKSDREALMVDVENDKARILMDLGRRQRAMKMRYSVTGCVVRWQKH